MTESSSGEDNLPQVLPPEEADAASGEVGVENVGKDLAEQESAWLTDSLSAHAVRAAALKNDLANAYIKNLEADREMRKTYAGRILKYLEFYSIGVLLVIILAGIGPLDFDLESGVLTTLVGSTAVAAIGLVGFIARGLFQSPPPPPVE